MDESYETLEYFENIPVSKYVKLSEIRNTEINRINRERNIKSK